MTTFTVTKVRKALSDDGTHRHIVGVCISAATFYTNQQVVNSIDAGNTWQTEGSDGSHARIRKLSFCPATSCLHKPYLTTNPDHTTKNNLENLPAC